MVRRLTFRCIGATAIRFRLSRPSAVCGTTRAGSLTEIDVADSGVVMADHAYNGVLRSGYE
jgi:hypothetical protein